MSSPVDFRYAPLQWQTAFCFPDDPHKNLVDRQGRLLYGHPGWKAGAGIDYFPEVVEFSLNGMEAPRDGGQRLDSPRVPVVYTVREWPRARMELTTFATNRPEEGRVDNVLMRIEPRTAGRIRVAPRIVISTREPVKIERKGDSTLVYLGADRKLFAIIGRPATLSAGGWRAVLPLGDDSCGPGEPLACFIRFPQQNQPEGKLAAGMREPESLLAGAKSFWEKWTPFSGPVSWQLPGVYQDFLLACACNIQQAREYREGRLAFQVGPTLYRDLWVADGNFILESARYLGLDKEVQSGLEATWSCQDADGAVYAAASKAFKEHWKDTAIAMFSLVRQAELSQDWSYYERMAPNVLRGVRFIDSLRERARREPGPSGKYGLLAKGLGDGGLMVCWEFTNSLWTLAGLKAVAGAPKTIAATEPARRLYAELRASLVQAAEQEKRRHPAGFDYLHMLLKDDPLWKAPNEWYRPRPQTAQWALSQTIYPGQVFDQSDWIVNGHIQLMQSCMREEVPYETGAKNLIWAYNAAFVAQVYLWAGRQDWARRVFHGFLNHASPLYGWREEQPLRDALAGEYLGDMPHNWASAECIRYLRHMLALEDGDTLRLLAGIGAPELEFREPFLLSGSPTRFGRIDLALEPSARSWTLSFRRKPGFAPRAVVLPARLAPGRALSGVQGAAHRVDVDRVLIAPDAAEWKATWA